MDTQIPQNQIKNSKQRWNAKKEMQGKFDLSEARVMPNAKDLEIAIIGSILLDKDAYDTVSEIIKTSDCFYDDANKTIFCSIQDMNKLGKKVDMLTLVEYLHANKKLEEVGGPYYITKTTNMVSSTAHLKEYCEIVFQKFINRELIKLSSKILHDSYQELMDPFELLEQSESVISQLLINGTIRSYIAVGSLSLQGLIEIEKKKYEKEKAVKEGKPYCISGIDSGYPSINAFTEGWQPSDLIILAARPSVGKTAFALNLSYNAALNGQAVGFFSLEMTRVKIMNRLFSIDTGISLYNISNGRLTDDESRRLTNSAEKYSKVPLYIDDTSSLSITEFKSKVRRMVIDLGVKMVFLDYLQLMSGGKEKSFNREREIADISRNMKILANELNIPIIALSQLSRAVEQRKESNPIPQLSDLRESGAIEQDADVVIFATRDDYGETEEDREKNGMDKKYSKVRLKWAKHRNGALDYKVLTSDLSIQKFYDPTNDPQTWPSETGSWKPIKQLPSSSQDDLPF
ncbi:replicative DNA helicase [Rhizosphaericola mali]|uniref:Replicative DNA helicase n=1 Tax=Rhizosphaericola mali TaxID=2545455 RepID=A0A5P2FZ83_9BACT|nr:replicative DNA helicase [Rhizosphaericola mali]QES88836.1 replicative DNA helicase [Rhizosphaericola mali]